LNRTAILRYYSLELSRSSGHASRK
jgi:hypothetical protein